jgi:microcystin-dependent protein
MTLTLMDCSAEFLDVDPSNLGCDAIRVLSDRVEDMVNALCQADSLLPTGIVVPYGGDEGDVPVGWLLCDGSEVSRATYDSLFLVVGEIYGAGDMTTTFNIPDLRGRIPLGADNMGGSSADRVTATQADNLGQSSGAETHAVTIPEMPAHTHSITGFFGGGGTPWLARAADFTQNVIVRTTLQTAGSDTPHKNMQPYQTTNFIIKA